MNKSELLAALKGRPVPFTTPLGATVPLRPVTLPERLALFAWLAENKDQPGTGQALMNKYVSLGLCNGDGDPAFTEEEIPVQPIPAVDFDAIAEEVSRRAGLEGNDAGKPSPATPS